MLNKLLDFRGSLLWRLLEFIEKAAMVVCGAGITALLCYETIIRYLFRMPLYSYEEVATIFSVWLYFIGSAYSFSKRTAIQADMASLFLKEKGQRINALIVDLLSAAISVVLSVWSFQFIGWALEKNALTTGLKIPVVVSQMSICVGYTLMAFYSVVYFLENAVTFVGWAKGVEK